MLRKLVLGPCTTWEHAIQPPFVTVGVSGWNSVWIISIAVATPVTFSIMGELRSDAPRCLATIVGDTQVATIIMHSKSAGMSSKD